MNPFAKMSTHELNRRIENDEFLLASLRREAERINHLLDLIERGEIDTYLNNKSDRIKEVEKEVNTKKLILLMRESGMG